ncbi:hypothetical protein [Candidatus Frankia nodulisporulans]|uniref:hypothetical protein n=1 Tax=Candidatus Frankia nodulisporulans TaxID=2060052 RepID=UPI001CDB88FD|nr:hypothetical protein [Candidatus Frankia nodulisporulans]
MEIDKVRLDASLARLHHQVPSQVELAKLVSEVVGAVTEIFDLAGAGVLLVDADRALRSIAASDSTGALLERVQEEFGEGPCVESFIVDEIVVSNDITTDDRWPLGHPGPGRRGRAGRPGRTGTPRWWPDRDVERRR